MFECLSLTFLNSSYDGTVYHYLDLCTQGLNLLFHLLMQGGPKTRANFWGTKSFGGPFLLSPRPASFDLPLLTGSSSLCNKKNYWSFKDEK